MDQRHPQEISIVGENPTFTMAGVMPGGTEMGHWNTAVSGGGEAARSREFYAGVAGKGPVLSSSGAMPGAPQTAWLTAMNTGEATAVAELGAARRRALIRRAAGELGQQKAR